MPPLSEPRGPGRNVTGPHPQNPAGRTYVPTWPLDELVQEQLEVGRFGVHEPEHLEVVHAAATVMLRDRRTGAWSEVAPLLPNRSDWL